MSAFKDLTGNRYGKIFVLKRIDNDKDGGAKFLCECDCGNTINVRGVSITNGHTKSCGCLKRELVSKRMLKDLTGKRFGSLIVLCISHRDKHRNIHYLCHCDCNNGLTVRGSNLIAFQTKSCGCLQRQKVSLIRWKDLSGKQFGRLTVLKVRKDLPRTSSGSLLWECQCQCGNICITDSSVLIKGVSKSCGCYNRDIVKQQMQINRQSPNFNMNWLMKRQQKLLGL